MTNFKKILASLIAITVGVTTMGCVPNTNQDQYDDYDISTRVALDSNEISYSLTEYDTYNNYIGIKDWNGNNHGSADPFVMRYNGEYYLFCTAHGMPVWKSTDMINWQYENHTYEKVDGQFGEEVTTPYAPEVVYYRGYFYLCESPLGRGHYIFRSKSPTGMFTICSGDGTISGGNIGLGIDGSFYIDENDELYLFSAEQKSGITNGTRLTKLNFDANGLITAGDTIILPQVYMGMWTEGASVLERNGYNYITYSGNHYLSAGYRVGYSYFNGNPYNSVDGVVTPKNNHILLTTGDDKAYTGTGYNVDSSLDGVLDSFRGLGHNSNFYGPNLDSVYTAFHNAKLYDAAGVMGSGFSRAYNLGQYYTNGNTLMTNGLSDFDTVFPKDATYTANGLNLSGDWQLSTQESEKVYTAELNLTLDGTNGSVVVGYIDSLNYTEIKITATQISVEKYVDGKKSVLQTANLPTYFNYEGFHTVKVINGYASSTVYYDNLKKIQLNSPLSDGGKVGVKVGNVAGSVQFTNDAYGTSDFESVKNLTGTFPAYSYLKEENRGYNIKEAVVKSDGVRQGEKETTKKVDGTYVTTLKSGDWVKYGVNAPSANTYSLNVKVSKASENCIFEVIINDTDIYKMKISGANLIDGKFVMVNAGSFTVNSKGVHSMKIRVYKGTLEMTDISTVESIDIGNAGNQFTNPLTENFNEGKKILGNHAFSVENGMTTLETDDKSVYYFGNKIATNFEFSIDVKVSNKPAGLLMRTKNFSYNPSDAATVAYSFQGYYLEVGKFLLKLHKYDYSDATLATVGDRTFSDGGFHRITIRGIQNKIEVFINGVSVLSYIDEYPFLDGYCGIYSVLTESSYKNLSYKVL